MRWFVVPLLLVLGLGLEAKAQQDCPNGSCQLPGGVVFQPGLLPGPVPAPQPTSQWYQLEGHPGWWIFGSKNAVGQVIVQWHWHAGMPSPQSGPVVDFNLGPAMTPSPDHAANYGLDLSGMHREATKGKLITNDNAFAKKLQSRMGSHAPPIESTKSILPQGQKEEAGPLIEGEVPLAEIGQSVPLNYGWFVLAAGLFAVGSYLITVAVHRRRLHAAH